MDRKTNLYLISGFLGSGKTTFLQKMLLNFEGKKIGVIINEFGSIGIDGQLIKEDGIKLIEINNGSIFCSCLKGDFIQALIHFSKEPIDTLFIENSGMADPSNIHQILSDLKDKVERPYEYKGAVCIVDSVNFLKHIKVLTPVQNQVASSDFIIVNKIDMVNQTVLKEIEEKIHEINPSAYIFQTIYSQVPISVIEKKLFDNGYIGQTSNQPWNRPVTYALESEEIFTEQEILDFINKIKDYVFRIKGFVKGDFNWWKVDVVDDNVRITETELGKKDIIENTKIIIIGKDSKELSHIIKNVLKRRDLSWIQKN